MRVMDENKVSFYGHGVYAIVSAIASQCSAQAKHHAAPVNTQNI